MGWCDCNAICRSYGLDAEFAEQSGDEWVVLEDVDLGCNDILGVTNRTVTSYPSRVFQLGVGGAKEALVVASVVGHIDSARESCKHQEC